jgi:predicted RNase H-like HicB family nuclease
MRHYITMFVKTDAGGWRAMFPDFPECEAAGESLDAATVSALLALTQHAHDRGLPLPPPSSLSEVQQDADSIAGRGIALERAIVSLVPLNGFDGPEDSTP